MPQPPLVPADARFLSGVPAATPAWFCPSGHIAVRPTINGQQAGFMMLDTGGLCFAAFWHARIAAVGTTYIHVLLVSLLHPGT